MLGSFWELGPLLHDLQLPQLSSYSVFESFRELQLHFKTAQPQLGTRLPKSVVSKFQALPEDHRLLGCSLPEMRGIDTGGSQGADKAVKTGALLVSGVHRMF